MTRLALIAAYLTGAAIAVLFINDSPGVGLWAILPWAVASALLGGGTGQPGLAFLAVLPILFAVPFDYPEDLIGEPLPVWSYVAFCAFVSATLIFLTALVRNLIDARRSG